MDKTAPQHHLVIAIGALNAVLTSAFEQLCRHQLMLGDASGPSSTSSFERFSVTTDALCVTTHWIDDPVRAMKAFPDKPLAGQTRAIWLFINESQMDEPGVKAAVAHACQGLAVFVFCFQEDVAGQGRNPDDSWPQDWASADECRSPVVQRYSLNDSCSLHMLRHLLPRAGKIAEDAIYAGETAREKDPYYAPARDIVLAHQRASISLVQRLLGIGYNHSERLLNAMEGDILEPRRSDGTRVLRQSQ